MTRTKWMLTLREDCDLDALGAELETHGVEIDRTLNPLPLDRGEQAVTVSVAGRLPDAVKHIKGVLRANPSSELSLF